MSRNTSQPTFADQGFPAEELSSEVLKLKFDDLFQEIENLTRRLERLEGQLNLVPESRPEA